WLAICGIPPFSGFFSKDEILWQAFSSTHGSLLFWGLGAATAVMTAFYMTRLFSLTFLGKLRSKDVHVHEPPNTMVVPLQILAVLSVIGGFMGIPHLSWLDHWLDPVIPAHHGLPEGIAPSMEWVLMAVSVAGAALGIYVALRMYSNLEKVEEFKRSWARVHKILMNKWYIDEIYEFIFVKPIHEFSKFLWKYFDVAVVDRFINGLGRGSMWSGQVLRLAQTGSIQFYALVLFLGIMASVGYLIYGMA
ncbi:NADH-quinone oxidoreductase subunit L, partial [Bdellovibrionota bacterium FG-2]